MRISDWSSDVCSSDLNLLGNAIKFTEPGGTIRVEAKINAAGGLDLAVHDDGIGIAQDDIPLVLQPFNQVRDAYLREKGGTGLGLPIVVGMARLHGGDFRSEEHTSELQSLMRISYAVFCLKKKKHNVHNKPQITLTLYNTYKK